MDQYTSTPTRDGFRLFGCPRQEIDSGAGGIDLHAELLEGPITHGFHCLEGHMALALGSMDRERETRGSIGTIHANTPSDVVAILDGCP